MTATEQICEVVAALLIQVPNCTVWRSRTEAINRAEGTALVVMPKEEPVENKYGGGSSGFVLRNFSLQLSIIARAQPGGFTADQVADPVMQCAHGFVMADTTLGGLVATVIERGREWDFEIADGTALALDAIYEVRYMTRANTLSIGST